jgi:Tol biopolymer transport system component
MPLGISRTYFRRGAFFVLTSLALSAVGAAAPDAPQEGKKVVRRGIPAIWVMDSDGSNPRPLVKVRGVRWHGSPTWSRDGKQIAFDVTVEGFERGEVYLYAYDGPQKGTLKNLGPGNCPVFSPDGKTIAFHLAPQNAAAGEAGVYLMKPDGTDRRRLCAGDHAKWSPDGTKMLLADEQRTPARIDEVTLKTGEVRRVLDSAYAKIPGAVYSPDAKKMAFIGYDDQQLTRADLVVMDIPAPGHEPAVAGATAPADGAAAAAPAAATAADQAKAVRGAKVLHGGRLGWIPNWSPDGKQITFVTWEKKDGTDYDFTQVIDADGKSPMVRLKNQENQGTRTSEAEWTADGKLMVFASDREFPADLLAEKPDPPASGL